MRYKELLVLAISFLMLCSVSGTVAQYGEGSIQGLDAVINDEDFDVKVIFVGTSATTQGKLNITSEGTYDIVSDSAFTSVAITLNISGFSDWTGQESQLIDFVRGGVANSGKDDVIAGSLFVIVDNEVTPTTSFVGASGATVVMARGDHTVTFIYASNTPTGFEWASDSVVIRIRNGTSPDFGSYETKALPLDLAVTDSAIPGRELLVTPSNYAFNGFSGAYEWFKNTSSGLEASTEVTVAYDQENIRIAGTVDSEGIDYYQAWGDGTATGYFDDFGLNGTFTEQLPYTTKRGRTFLIDADGAHLLTGAETLAGPSTVTVRDENDVGEFTPTYVGLVTLAPYGRTSAFIDTVTDYEGFTSGQGFKGSFDYVYDGDGAFLTVPPTYVTSLTTNTVTSTVLSTGGVPGFTSFEAIFGLISLGVIAFVIPRFRKEK
jgi:hypothetical protein